MTWNACETLDFIQPFLPGAIVTDRAFARAKRIASLLPGALSSYYLECRLEAGAGQTDFLTCTQGREEVDALARSARGDAPNPFTEFPSWNGTYRFCGEWLQSSSPLADQVPLVWLEFDSIDQDSTPLPCFSFCLDPGFLQGYGRLRETVHFDAPRSFHVAETGLEALFGTPPAAPAQESLANCFDRLPAGGRIIHVSVMLARVPAVVKLYVVVPKGELFDYLAAIGYPGTLGEIHDLVTTFCHSIDRDIFIDLTIADEVAPRLGIAFAQDHLRLQAKSDPARKLLLDQCVDCGICTPEKRRALVGWPGAERQVFSGEKWPTRINRWLDVKLVYHPDRPLEAKGYLGFMPIFAIF